MNKQSTHWMYRRTVRVGALFIITVVLLSMTHRLILRAPKELKEEFDHCPNLLGPVGGSDQGSTIGSGDDNEQSLAKIMLPSELMAMLEGGETPPRRIIHQSWKNDKLPDRFQRWSRVWRSLHGPTWVYVLWTDEDNRKLTRDYYPEYLYAYNSLPREIYRADMVRNMYMHRFGGIYADLDLLPLVRIDTRLPELVIGQDRQAYVGQMGDDTYEHSIPNAFLASSLSGHPFWIRPLEFVNKYWNDTDLNGLPEYLTGPVALRNCTKQWLAEERATLSEPNVNRVQVIEDGKIYPFSWTASATLNWCLCRAHSPWFSESKCNGLYPDAWTITYWTHSWGWW